MAYLVGGGVQWRVSSAQGHRGIQLLIHRDDYGSNGQMCTVTGHQGY